MDTPNEDALETPRGLDAVFGSRRTDGGGKIDLPATDRADEIVPTELQGRRADVGRGGSALGACCTGTGRSDFFCSAAHSAP